MNEEEVVEALKGLQNRIGFWIDGVITNDELLTTINETKELFEEFDWLMEK